MPHRKKQFKRSRPVSMRPTEDDLTICRLLRTYRLASFSDICNALPHRSPRKLRERMRVLFDNRIVDRPRAQQEYHVPGRRPETLYAIGDAGADLLVETDGWRAPKSSWTDKNRSMGRPHLKHTYGIAQLRLALATMQDVDPDLDLISADQILAGAPEATQGDQTPWQWHGAVIERGATVRIARTVPDHVFGLQFNASRQRFYFWAEVDRATMPVCRSKGGSTSINRKFEAYFAGFQANYHQKRYGIGNFRVLFLTSSHARIQTMISTLQDIAPDHEPPFLFTTAHQLSKAPTFLDVPWLTSHSATTTLRHLGAQDASHR